MTMTIERRLAAEIDLLKHGVKDPSYAGVYLISMREPVTAILMDKGNFEVNPLTGMKVFRGADKAEAYINQVLKDVPRLLEPMDLKLYLKDLLTMKTNLLKHLEQTA